MKNIIISNEYTVIPKKYTISENYAIFKQCTIPLFLLLYIFGLVVTVFLHCVVKTTKKTET